MPQRASALLVAARIVEARQPRTAIPVGAVLAVVAAPSFAPAAVAAVAVAVIAAAAVTALLVASVLAMLVVAALAVVAVVAAAMVVLLWLLPHLDDGQRNRR
jgi:hypothetical protein